MVKEQKDSFIELSQKFSAPQILFEKSARWNIVHDVDHLDIGGVVEHYARSGTSRHGSYNPNPKRDNVISIGLQRHTALRAEKPPHINPKDISLVTLDAARLS